MGNYPTNKLLYNLILKVIDIIFYLLDNIIKIYRYFNGDYMSKVCFYQVQLRNGHSQWSEVVPAHSAAHAEAYNNNPDLRVEAKFIGFHDVDVNFNGDVIFFACDREFEPNNVGYDYLYNQLLIEVNQMLSDMDY